MRSYFQEGDLLVAEVQQIGNQDGAATLHTRSLKYGKLRNGMYLAVSGTGGGGGVIRSRRQVWTIDAAHRGGEIDVVLGVNGYIWLAKHSEAEAAAAKQQISISNIEETVSNSIYSSQNDEISRETRQEIARLASCINLLAEESIRVDEATVTKAYEAAVEISADAMDVDGATGQIEVANRKRIIAAVLEQR